MPLLDRILQRADGAPRDGAPAQAARTFELAELGSRTYHFPSTFEDVEMLIARFLVPAAAVRRWLPPPLTPVSAAGIGYGMVTVQRLGRPPDGMAPYLEGSLSVGVRGRRGGARWHTLTMPVDSFENRQRGLYIFGYPKEMAQVSLENAGRERIGTVRTLRDELAFSIQTAP